jgi:hypothetical protein
MQLVILIECKSIRIYIFLVENMSLKYFSSVSGEIKGMKALIKALHSAILQCISIN